MKKLIYTFLAALSFNAFATGDVTCSVSLNNGTRYEVGACIPHSDIMGLCGPIAVLKNDSEIARIDPAQNDGLWIGDGMVMMRILDENFEKKLIVIKYFGKNDRRNSLTLDLPGARTSRGKAIVFRDVKCELN
jgi:hypothetical protein